jgi:hypothetical protein
MWRKNLENVSDYFKVLPPMIGTSNALSRPVDADRSVPVSIRRLTTHGKSPAFWTVRSAIECHWGAITGSFRDASGAGPVHNSARNHRGLPAGDELDDRFHETCIMEPMV